MISTALMIVALALPAARPPVANLGTVDLDAPGRHVPQTVLIVGPLALPEVTLLGSSPSLRRRVVF